MSSDIGEKYRTVLNALIDQNYHVINDVYLDMFISHISGRSGEGMEFRRFANYCEMQFFQNEQTKKLN